MLHAKLFVIALLQFSSLLHAPTPSDCKTGACAFQIDDAIAMIQGRATVSLALQMSEDDPILLMKSSGVGHLLQVEGGQRLAATQRIESSMENAVTKMLNGNYVVPPPEYFEPIEVQLELMRAELVGERDGFQIQMNSANANVAKCNQNMQNSSEGSVAAAKASVDALNITHHTCRVAEKTAYDAKTSSCDALATETSEVSKDAPECNCELPGTSDASVVLACLTSNRVWVTSSETNLKSSDIDCNTKTTTWSSKADVCDEDQSRYEADVCDEDQSRYEVAVCSYAKKLENMRSTLDTCYNDAISARTSTEELVKLEEKHLKAVLASVKKIVCFLRILKKANATDLTMSDFETCKNMDVFNDNTYLNNSVPDMNITYLPADAKNIDAHQWNLSIMPGDGQWAATEYAGYTKEWLRDTAVCSHKITTTTTNASCETDETADTKLGVIGYWSPTESYYDTLPNGSLAVINPSNGIFDSTQQDTEKLGPNICLYKQAATTAVARGSRILGYVSTGYFNHSCNQLGSCQTWARIAAQVEKYFEVFPSIEGIFFDETAPPPAHWNCSAFSHEYATLRNIVKNIRADATIAFNTAIPDSCVVDGVEAGEILVLYEKEVEGYGAPCDSTWEQDNIWWATQKAKDRNIETWHLVHTASQSEALDALQKARHYGVDWFYATNIGGDWQNGENTWGQPPVYWDLLKDQLHLPAASEVVQQVSATLSTDSFGQKILTLKRPPAQCCHGSDWVGIYKKGTWDRVNFLYSYNEFNPTVVFPLDCLTEGVAAGEYEFKYLTSLDNWVAHNLEPILSIP